MFSDIYAFNWIIWLFFALSIIILICVDFTYGIVITDSTLIYQSYKPLFVHGVLYFIGKFLIFESLLINSLFSVPIVILICILPKVILKLYRNEFKPSPTTKLKLAKRELKNQKSQST